jgi:putative ABC transport system permease protein
MKNNDWKSFDKNVQPLGLQMTSLKKVKNDKKVDVTFMAINPDSYLNPEVIKGAKLSDGQQNEIVVDSSLEKEGVKIGDVLKDERTSTSFKVTGFTKKQTFGHTPVGFITLKTWNEFSKDTYNAFTIKTDNKKVENNFSKIVDGGKWVNKDKVVNGIPGYSAEQSSLNMMLVFLIIIATFVLGVFFYIMTIQKVSQFGILKAIGTNTSSLIFSTISQVFILSVISIAFAIGFTALMAHFMPDGVPFVFDTMLFLKYTGILIVVSLLGSLISTFNIVKADPIQSMGRVE